MKSLIEEKKVIGLTTKGYLLILLALITCICNGQKLTSDYRTFESQTDYSTYFGRHVKRTSDRTGFVTLRIDVLDSPSCRAAKQLTKQQFPVTQDSVFYQSLEQMQRKCLRIRLYRSRSTIPSFLNRSKTEWIDLKQN